jgi:Flp pilus assembly pilin Flp
MRNSLVGLWTDEEAVTTVEYALLLGTVVVASIGAWTSLGASIRDAVNQAADEISAAGTGTTTPTSN